MLKISDEFGSYPYAAFTAPMGIN